MGKEGKRIIGIKAIADYLDASERTVFRWEKELGLPLQRVAGTRGSSVFIYVVDLEEWLKNRNQTDKAFTKFSKNHTIFIASVVIVFLIVITALVFFLQIRFSPKKKELLNPISSSIIDNMVFVKDVQGKNIWSYITYNTAVEPEIWWERKSIDFLDVDGDGANEVISREFDPVKKDFFLTMFDNDGAILWKKTVNNQQTYCGIHLRSNFIPGCTRFTRQNDGQIFVITNWSHEARFLSLITSHNLNGELVHNYVHTGHLRSLEIYDLDNDGSDEILFTGTNNLLNGEGVLGVLNLSDFRGVCPPYQVEPDYKHMEFRLRIYVPDNPEIGNQRLYIRFKRSSLFEEQQKTYIFAQLHDIDGDLIHVQLFPWDLQYQNYSCYFEYVFNKNFDFIYVIPDSAMLKAYPEMLIESENNIPISEAVSAFEEVILSWKNGNWVPLLKKQSDN